MIEVVTVDEAETQVPERPKNIFFPRDPTKPLVSILLPTRRRPAFCAASIDSFFSLANDKAGLEFILKIDDDDEETIKLYEKLKQLPIDIKAIISPRGKGYSHFHHWINEMAAMAKGEWLFVSNDDCRMASQDWDQTLLTANIIGDSPWHGCTEIINFLCITIDRPEATEFYFLRRKVFDILGHVSLNPHCDTWVTAVLCGVSSTFKIPVYIHHVSEHLKDSLRGEVLEVYKITGRNLNTCEAYRQKATDTLKLVDYIEKWQKEHNCFRVIVEE